MMRLNRNSAGNGTFCSSNADVKPVAKRPAVMHSIIYLIGLVVVVMFILSALGLR